MNNTIEAVKIKEEIKLPDVQALAANARAAAILSRDGEIVTLPHNKAVEIVKTAPSMVCNAPYICSKLKIQNLHCFDVLELFAFIHPAKFCVPTPAGMAKYLGLEPPREFEDYPLTLLDISAALLSDLRSYADRIDKDERKKLLDIATVMGVKGKGWPWTPFIFSALGEIYDPVIDIISKSALNVWKQLPEWVEEAPAPAPSHFGVSDDEAEERLAELLSRSDAKVEIRAQQQDYTKLISKSFLPVNDEESPHIVLAEAGTGVGKTLGYLAPSSVWAEKNDASVWISTYTKNLQRQIDSELDRLYPNPDIKNAFVTIRKGRENYLCLLNLEDMSAGALLAKSSRQAIAAGIMARWCGASKDGDLNGPDFPGWLAGILEPKYSVALADRRGECVFSACDHYHRCFVERSIRKSRHARIVVANHALVMIQSALSSTEEELPTRYIFDEGHHLFDAADSAFSAHLSAREIYDLRRWLLGFEGGKRSRARGLKRRAEDLLAGDGQSEELLQNILHHAHFLTSLGWSRRLVDENPHGVAEKFLYLVYRQVLARAKGSDGPYSLETEIYPTSPELVNSAENLRKALCKLYAPMDKLSAIIRKKLSFDDGYMDSDTRKRLDALALSLDRRSKMTIKAWIDLLKAIEKGGEGSSSSTFVDWLGIERIEGKTFDVGAYRHYKDPMKPFAVSLRPHLHGMSITSATLCDKSNKNSDDGQIWQAAQERSGAGYLGGNLHNGSFESPFDYKSKTRIFIVNDIRKNDPSQVANAYRVLFKASGGGGIGLFTAISRLKQVYQKIACDLEACNIPLFAQHVDEMDVGTLVDIFRDDDNACLLGTDAVRDGVDVPGSSLRLIVFDRVPWPRPTILHKARRELFGQSRYDDMLTRLKLKQAYGRLIRRESDRGVFVMLDSGFPSRLYSAFPDSVDIVKAGLSEVAEEIKVFL